MRTPLSTLTLLVLTVRAATQSVADHALVATLFQGQTQLLDVDLTTGAFVVLPRFPSDGHAPLAVAVDPVDGRAIVAIDRGGHTFVHRVGPADERLLADIPGLVTDLALAEGGDVFASVGGASGGIWRIPRNGGSQALLAAIPRASALATYGIGSNAAWVAVSGSNAPVLDPQARIVDLRTGATVNGPFVYTGYQVRGLTGIADLPTGAPRELVTDEGGNVSSSFGFGTPTPLQFLPQLPPGATRALVMRTAFDGVVLGGAAHPFLKTFFGYQSPQNWRMLAGPLPGDPVDFDLMPPRVASTEVFGKSCPGSAGMFVQSLGVPSLGNASFGLQLLAMPVTPTALVLGASEQVFLGQPLPLSLPGGCQLLVAAPIVLPSATNAAGSLTQVLGVPNDPWLRGGRVFAQWFQFPALGITASAAVALRLW